LIKGFCEAVFPASLPKVPVNFANMSLNAVWGEVRLKVGNFLGEREGWGYIDIDIYVSIYRYIAVERRENNGGDKPNQGTLHEFYAFHNSPVQLL
jgi:hypothetical protein